MTTTEKRGFRLPWGTENRKPDDDTSGNEAPGGQARPVAKATDLAAAITTVEGTSSPRAGTLLRRGQVDDLGRGPFDVGPMSAEETAAVADGLVEVEEPAPPKAAAEPEPEADPESTTSANPAAAWPDSDRRGSPTHLASDAPPPPRPTLVVEGATRKVNPLVAGLVKAMREAAKSARDESMARMRSDAAARIDEIKAEGLGAGSMLKKQADEDIAKVREWSKAEAARIRQESETRIADRRARLVAEAQEHAAKTERHTAEVKAAIEAFETEMQRFFDILLAEEDPARLAALAERLPEAPSFARPVGLAADSAVRRAARPTRSATPRRRTEPSARKPRPAPRLGADDAAAAEAEAIAGLDEELEALRSAFVPAEVDAEPEADAPFEEPAAAAEPVVDAHDEPAGEPWPQQPDDHEHDTNGHTVAVEPAPVAEPDADSLAAWNDALAALRAAGRDDDLPGAAQAAMPDAPSADESLSAELADVANATDAEAPAGSLLAVLADAPRINSPDDLSPEERIALLGFDETAEPDPEPATPAVPVEDVTRIVVTGLSSVAGISAFKSALSAATGVLSVSVTSGVEGSFVFSVVHAASADLRAAIPGFARFEPELTSDEGAVLSFSVTEPAP